MGANHSNVGLRDSPPAQAPSRGSPPSTASAPPEESPSPDASAQAALQHPLLALPEDVIATVLSHTWCTARAASRTCCSLADSTRTHLRLQPLPYSVPRPTSLELRRLLARLPQLRMLDSANVRVFDLDSIAVPSLTSLDACLGSLNHNLGSVTDLGPLSRCTRMTSLRLTRCTRLVDITGLSGPAPSLLTLHLHQCFSLCDLSPLAACTRMTRLSLGGWELVDLGPLEGCVSVQTPTLCNCDSLTCLGPLPACPALTSLTLSRVPQLFDVAPLAACPALTSLTLSRLPLLSDIAPLAMCLALEQVVIIKCYGLRDWRPLACCPQLRSLQAEEGDGVRVGCQSVVELRPEISIRLSAMPPPWSVSTVAGLGFDSD